jgi:hypothetical protein
MGSASSRLLSALADLPVGGVRASISSLLRTEALLQRGVPGCGAAVVGGESAGAVPRERKGASASAGAEPPLADSAITLKINSKSYRAHRARQIGASAEGKRSQTRPNGRTSN